MALKTTIEQLEEVQAAITAVMAGQEVRIGGKMWRAADLAALEKRETSLLARYRAEQAQSAGGFSNKVRFEAVR